MIYRIYDKIKKVFLDRNLYYMNQRGVFYKIGNPLPIKLKDQERYEIVIVKEESEISGN